MGNFTANLFVLMYYLEIKGCAGGKPTAAICLLFLLFLCSCGGPRPGQPFVRRSYYPGGHVKSEISYIDDTIKDGCALYYFGQKDYYSIYMEEYFKKGIHDSIFKEYYPNGLVNSTGMYNYGVPMGSFYQYYADGRLKGYNAAGYDSRIFYAVLYDSVSGKEVDVKGESISKKVGIPDGKKIYGLRDTVHLVFCVAEPPHSSSHTQIGIWKTTDTGTGLLTEPCHPYATARSCIAFAKVLGSAGGYNIMAISTLYDTLSNRSVTDTTAIAVIVK